MYIKYLDSTEHDQTQEDKIDRRLRICSFLILVESSNHPIIFFQNIILICTIYKCGSSLRMGNYTTVTKPKFRVVPILIFGVSAIRSNI